MQKKAIENYALMVGIPFACVLDYFDEDPNPSINGLHEYKGKVDNDFDADTRWQARCRKEPINPGGYQGNVWDSASGYAAMLNNIRRV